MASDDSYWIGRAQSAEAKLQTLKEAYDPAIERIQQFKTNFGVKERSDGTLMVDFDRFAKAIGPESALELRRIIDELYGITGEAGQKPRMRVVATADAGAA